MPVKRLLASGFLVFAGLLAAPAAALAVPDLYAKQGGSGDCSTPDNACPLATAVTNAGATPGGANVHIVGQLTQNSTLTLAAANPIHLIGSGKGPGGTLIDTVSSSALVLNNGSTAENLWARSAYGGETVRLHYGSAITGSLIENTSPTSGFGINSNFSTQAPALVKGDTVNVSSNGIAVTVGNGGPGMSLVIEDSVLNGGQGINHTSGIAISLFVRRSTINASGFGLTWLVNHNATVAISSSVIHMTGSGGVAVSASSFGDYSSLLLTENTIDGSDASGTTNGLRVSSGASAPPQPIVATVNDSIVRGFSTDLLAEASGSASTAGGVINVARSDYSVALGAPAGGGGQSGAIGVGAGNLNVDPRFNNRAGGDYSLRADSPLIDAAGADPVDPGGPESATDRAGNPRILDGNGDGTAARDIGAFEYVRPAATKNGEPDSNIDKISRAVKTASITRRKRAKPSRKFTGTATDDSGVAKVELALARSGRGAGKLARKHKSKAKRCAWLTSRGKFKRSKARKGACTQRWLVATGTAKWSLKLRRKLPKGRYVLYSRATDGAGLSETKFSAADGNRVTFRVR